MSMSSTPSSAGAVASGRRSRRPFIVSSRTRRSEVAPRKSGSASTCRSAWRNSARSDGISPTRGHVGQAADHPELEVPELADARQQAEIARAAELEIQRPQARQRQEQRQVGHRDRSQRQVVTARVSPRSPRGASSGPRGRATRSSGKRDRTARSSFAFVAPIPSSSRSGGRWRSPSSDVSESHSASAANRRRVGKKRRNSRSVIEWSYEPYARRSSPGTRGTTRRAVAKSSSVSRRSNWTTPATGGRRPEHLRGQRATTPGGSPTSAADRRR